jgi:hypothetical protein
MKCSNLDHEQRTCFRKGLMMGDVSQEHVDLMLEVKKEMFDALESIRQLVPKFRRSHQPNSVAPKPLKPSSSQQGARRAPAQVEPTPRGGSQKKTSNAVVICTKLWLQVRSSILSQNDTHIRISLENLAQILWFLLRHSRRVKLFSC